MDLIGPASEVWDVCCDHGLVGLEVLRRNPKARVHFVDRVPSIMEALRGKLENMASAEKDRGTIHLGEAEALALPLRGTVVIAGVGGQRIEGILRRWIERELVDFDRLILGPHKDEDWLMEQLPGILSPTRWASESLWRVPEGQGRERPLWDFRRLS